MATVPTQNINTSITQINNENKLAVSVDCVIFGYDEDTLKILVSNCDMHPFEREYSLLGDIVQSDETTDEAAKRVLLKKTGFTDVFLDQVEVFSDINRHPLGRVITVAYYSLIKIDEDHLAHLEKDAYLHWIPIMDLASLAFDHFTIMHRCLQKMQRQLRTQPIGFNLLPKKFTLMQLQKLYEVVLQIELDKRNFRRKLNTLDILYDLNEIEQSVSHRPARLFSFDEKVYQRKKVSGFIFDL